MSIGRLTAAQVDALEALAGVDPPGRLVGGAAIAGFVAPYRTTRDLDLFWYARPALGDLVRGADAALVNAGFTVETLRSAPSYHQLRAAKGTDTLVIDLVALPEPAMADPERVVIGLRTLFVEPPQQLLVSKLCTLLGRQEIRDLSDVRALLEQGLDLQAAVLSAPRLDAGFSPLTLAWVLRDVPVRKLALGSGLLEHEATELEEFRDRLVERVLEWSVPSGG